MSNVQSFLLAFSKDKEKARGIAQDTAKGMQYPSRDARALLIY